MRLTGAIHPVRSRSLSIAFLSLLIVSLLSPALLLAEARYADGLAQAVEKASPGETIPILVRFHGAVSPPRLKGEMKGLKGAERRAYGIERLRSNLSRQAAEVIVWIENEESEGRASRTYSLWLTHGYALDLRADRIEVLAQFPQVATILYAPPRPVPEINEGDPWTDPGEGVLDDISWGVEDIQAQQMWDEGYTGEGILLAFIDTGCNINHTDLENHIWTNPDEIADNGLDDDDNEFVDDIHGWNFYDDNNNISDAHGHGAKVAGILVGDGTGGDTTGVAPGAEIMIIRNWAYNWSSEASHSAAVQYAVANGADFISCSMSFTHDGNEMDIVLRNTMETVHALGVIQCNSQGNRGDNPNNDPYNINLPGRCPSPWLHADQYPRGGVSAILGIGYYQMSGQNRVLGGASTRGPTMWDEPFYPANYRDYPLYDAGLLKPDLVAPGGVTSTSVGGGYTTFNHESSATPHVAASLALLKQAHPDASIQDLARALKMSAIDMGAPGHDNEWGAGVLQVYAAHEYLTMWENRGWLTLSVTDPVGAPVAPLIVSLNDSLFAGDGSYTTVHWAPAGGYTLEIYKYGFEPYQQHNVVITTQDTTALTIQLTRVPGPEGFFCEPIDQTVVLGREDTLEVDYTFTNASGEDLELTSGARTWIDFPELPRAHTMIDTDLSTVWVRGLLTVDFTICLLGHSPTFALADVSG